MKTTTILITLMLLMTIIVPVASASIFDFLTTASIEPTGAPTQTCEQAWASAPNDIITADMTGDGIISYAEALAFMDVYFASVTKPGVSAVTDFYYGKCTIPTYTPPVASPTVVTGLESLLVSTDKVILFWDAQQNIEKYEIYRDNVYLGSPITNSYTDTTVISNRQYQYRIYAVNAGGKGTFSEILYVETEKLPTDDPNIVTTPFYTPGATPLKCSPGFEPVGTTCKQIPIVPTSTPLPDNRCDAGFELKNGNCYLISINSNQQDNTILYGAGLLVIAFVAYMFRPKRKK